MGIIGCMRILLRFALIATLLHVADASAAQADAAAGPAACTPRVVDAWVRPPPMPMPMMAGFARIENPCATSFAVTGARSAAFASVELHETRVVDGVSRMRDVPMLPLPAGGEAVLRPGGLHLMLMRPASAPKVGDRVRVDFTLADGRSIGAEFEVRAADAR
jgi:copper(I)-binding protein